MKVSSGIYGFDELIDGGYNNSITAFYGIAGSGKTTFCLLAALNLVNNNKKVIYIDTEINFSVERIKQILQNKSINALDNIISIKVKSFKQQQDQIKNLSNLIRLGKVSLVIIDSIGHYYRSLYKKRPDLANRMLSSQLRILKEISVECPIIITNQVYMDIESNQIKMVGNSLIEPETDLLIRLEHDRNRILRIMKPVKKIIVFDIINEGVKITQY